MIPPAAAPPLPAACEHRGSACLTSLKTASTAPRRSLAQVAPSVDPRTPEGRKALEEFRASHADIFAVAAKAPGDVTATVVDRIDKTSRSKGGKGIEGRKVFDHDLVKRTLAKNLGGEPV